MKFIKSLIILFYLLPMLVSANDDLIHKIQIQDLWIRETVGNSKVTAAYGKIINNSDQTVYITKVESKAAKIVDIHKTVVEKDIASMIHINKLAIPSKDMVELKPGGVHLMLIEIKNKITKGDEISFDFFLEDGSMFSATGQVRYISDK
jgi:hypothetical protein